MGKAIRVNPNYKSLKQYKEDLISYMELLEFYVDLNLNVKFELFFGSQLPEFMDRHIKMPHQKYPLFLSEIAMLYKLDSGKYSGMLNDALLEFLATHFRDRVIFIVNKEGFLLYIMIMRISIKQRTMINTFFSEHIDDLESFQYLSREYNPEIEPYKLLDVKINGNDKLDDFAITYF